jgi:hypothetical protein
MYRNAIIIFGMAIPGIGLLVVLVVMWVMLGKFEQTRDRKVAAREQSRLAQLGEKALAAKLEPRRGQMEYWAEHLEKDVTQSMNVSLDAVLKRFDGNQLRMASARRPAGEGLLGSDVEAVASLFEITFEGGFGPMQETLAELETRVPQLVLDKMEIAPGSHTGQGYRRSLKFTVTYEAWAK